MDFAVTGLDGLVGSSDTGSSLASLASSDPEAKQKWCGSGFLKQGRLGATEDDWRSLKLSKTESMLLQQRNTLLKSNRTFFSEQQQMLSFSSPKSDAFSVDRTSQHATLPCFHLTSSAHGRNTGTIRSNIKGLMCTGVCRVSGLSFKNTKAAYIFGPLWGNIGFLVKLHGTVDYSETEWPFAEGLFGKNLGGVSILIKE